MRTIGPGEKFPIPSYYDKCKFQIRIAPVLLEGDEKVGGRDMSFIESSSESGQTGGRPSSRLMSSMIRGSKMNINVGGGSGHST